MRPDPARVAVGRAGRQRRRDRLGGARCALATAARSRSRRPGAARWPHALCHRRGHLLWRHHPGDHAALGPDGAAGMRRLARHRARVAASLAGPHVRRDRRERGRLRFPPAASRGGDHRHPAAGDRSSHVAAEASSLRRCQARPARNRTGRLRRRSRDRRSHRTRAPRGCGPRCRACPGPGRRRRSATA